MRPQHRTEPQGPFSLADQNRYFGGWASLGGEGDALVMAFPLEGWEESAAVTLRQEPDGAVVGSVHGARAAGPAWAQAMAVLSLDVDGRGYPDVGERDPVIGALQREHAHLRPVLFHSPYEAACGFLIGHRLRIVQARAIRRRLAEAHGDAVEVSDSVVHAFPRPQQLLEIGSAPGITTEKVERLHGVARAALEGRLDRARLRAMETEEALAWLRTLHGVGAFFAQGILLRGAGTVDVPTGDEITLAGVRRLYGEAAATAAGVASVVEGWRPYRTWCSVLVHAAERRSRG